MYAGRDILFHLSALICSGILSLFVIAAQEKRCPAEAFTAGGASLPTPAKCGSVCLLLGLDALTDNDATDERSVKYVNAGFVRLYPILGDLGNSD